MLRETPDSGPESTAAKLELQACAWLARLPAGDGAQDCSEESAGNIWYVYLLECSGGRLYTGITNRLAVRMRAHAVGRGARFTRAFPPRDLVGCRRFQGRAEASKAEFALKQIRKSGKLSALLANAPVLG